MELKSQLFILLSISFCAAGISFTITTTSMFKWLREMLSPIHKKVEELLHCPWCLGHWIVFIIMLCSVKLPLVEIAEEYWFNWLFTAFAIITPMGLIHYVLLRAYKPIHKMLFERALGNLKKLKDKEP